MAVRGIRAAERLGPIKSVLRGGHTRRKRIVMVHPKFPPSFWSFGFIKEIGGFKAVMPPLGLATVAALTPDDYDVTIVDENIEEIDFEVEADLIVLSAMGIQEQRLFEIADRFRASGHTVCMGGPICNVVPERCRPHCDVLFEGEGEYTWKAFLAAWEFRPIRAEPLYELSRLYRAAGKPRLAYLYSRMAVEMPYPHQDILFIGSDVYDWRALDEMSSTAFYVHRFQEGFEASKRLMANKNVPESERERIKSNYDHYRSKITEIEKDMQEHKMRVKNYEKDQKKKLEAEKKAQNPPEKTFKKRKKIKSR